MTFLHLTDAKLADRVASRSLIWNGPSKKNTERMLKKKGKKEKERKEKKEEKKTDTHPFYSSHKELQWPGLRHYTHKVLSLTFDDYSYPKSPLVEVSSPFTEDFASMSGKTPRGRGIFFGLCNDLLLLYDEIHLSFMNFRKQTFEFPLGSSVCTR